MNTAVIIAGGSGTRTGQSVPKQFLTINDTPIIVYTMKRIEEVEDIDEIVVVCAKGWENFIHHYAKQYGITKLTAVVEGGSIAHESIYNAIKHLENAHAEDDLVGIFDANRPMVQKNMIIDCYASAKEHGAALTVEPCYDSMFFCHGDGFIGSSTDRDLLFKGQRPETARLGLLSDAYARSMKDEIFNLSPSALLLHYGKKVAAVRGSAKNIKITTEEDFDIFRAILNAEKVNN